jgi:muconolactone delta-isomerase
MFQVQFPPDMPRATANEVITAEAENSRRLGIAGTLARLWRLQPQTSRW